MLYITTYDNNITDNTDTFSFTCCQSSITIRKYKSRSKHVFEIGAFVCVCVLPCAMIPVINRRRHTTRRDIRLQTLKRNKQWYIRNKLVYIVCCNIHVSVYVVCGWSVLLYCFSCVKLPHSSSISTSTHMCIMMTEQNVEHRRYVPVSTRASQSKLELVFFTFQCSS